MKEQLLAALQNSLLKNSLFPILATAVTSFFGFLFWVLVAHKFTTSDVGLAGTLISVMNTLALFSLFGLDTSAIRYLSNSEKKNEEMTFGLIVITFVSITLTAVFLYFIPYISPSLVFMTENKITTSAFLIFTATSALNISTDALFLAFRSTKYTLIVNTIFSFIKLFLPFLFLDYGAFGILCAAATAQALGFLLSFRVLVKTFAYRPTFSFSTMFSAHPWKFSLGNYTADVIIFLPTAIIPILITNMLGAEQTAYYYIINMLAGFLYVIPASTTRSLFAEGSHDESTIAKNITHTLKITSILLTPLIFFFLLFGDTMLLFFGRSYQLVGSSFYNIMVFGSIVVTFFALYGSLLRLAQSIRVLILRSLTFAISTILFAYVLIPHGLNGVGMALIGGYSLAIVVSFLLFRKLNINF